MQTLSNRDVVDLLKRTLMAAPAAEQEAFADCLFEIRERCANNSDNWMRLIDCLGGIVSGLMLAISEHEQMNYRTVVGDLFNDEYAQIMDLDDEIEERNYRGTNSTRAGEGTHPIDRAVGLGEVDGLGDTQ